MIGSSFNEHILKEVIYSMCLLVQKIIFNLIKFISHAYNDMLDQAILLVHIYKTEETLNASREIADTRY